MFVSKPSVAFCYANRKTDKVKTFGSARIFGSTGDPEVDSRIHQLVTDWGCQDNAPLVEEMIVTALRMGRDNLPVADMKLHNRALKEFHHAARVFRNYTARPKIAIFGSARTRATEPAYLAAVDFAKRMVEQGFMVITGGGDGIMGAAQEGAGRENSFGLNIRLPFEQAPNSTIEGDSKLINFNYFFTRKLNFVKETEAVALFPGGFGTMDECFELLTLIQTGKARVIPIVMLDRPGGTYWKSFDHFLRDHLLRLGLISPRDFNLFKICESLDDAVSEVVDFYKVYHSARYVREIFVMRLKKRLTDAAVKALNEEFEQFVLAGKIEQRDALDEEANEPELNHLPRLVMRVDRSDFGRLRQLIDAVNRSEFVP